MKLFSVFVCSIAVFAAVCSGDQSGPCGDNVNFAYDPQTKVLTISGTGRMNNFTESSLPWQEYVGEITEAVIEDGVTTIGKYFCSQCSALKKVTVKGSLKGIYAYAFYSCDKLESATIHEMDGDVGFRSFANCTSLPFPTFEQGTIRTLDSESFVGCSSLVEVNVANLEGPIHNGAFADCKKLTTVTIKGSITSIDDGAFTDCESLKDLTLSGFNGEIVDTAFTHCRALSTVTVEGRVESINAFYKSGSKSFTEVKFGSVGTMCAFSSNYNLTSFIIAQLDGAIPPSAFRDCSKLVTVKIGAGSGTGKLLNNKAFSGCKSLKEFIIPSSIRDIYADAFANCTSLVKVYIPGTVTYVGTTAFADCPSLTNLRYEGKKELEAYGTDVFLRSDNLDKVSVPKDYANDTFCGKPVVKKDPDPASSSDSSSAVPPTSSTTPTSSSAHPASSSHAPPASSGKSVGEKNTVGTLAVLLAICLLLI